MQREWPNLPSNVPVLPGLLGLLSQLGIDACKELLEGEIMWNLQTLNS